MHVGVGVLVCVGVVLDEMDDWFWAQRLCLCVGACVCATVCVYMHVCDRAKKEMHGCSLVLSSTESNFPSLPCPPLVSYPNNKTSCPDAEVCDVLQQSLHLSQQQQQPGLSGLSEGEPDPVCHGRFYCGTEPHTHPFFII